MELLDIAFIFSYVLSPIITFRFMRKLNFSNSKFSIESFSILSIIIFAHVGLLPLYFGWDIYRYDIGVTDKVLIFYVLLLTLLSTIFLIFGFSFARKSLNRKSLSWQNINKLNSGEIIGLFVLFMISTAVLALYLTKISNIALFVALSDGSREAKVARSLMGNDFTGRYHWYTLFMHDILMFVSMAFFANYLINRKTWILLVFLSSFVILTFSLIMSIQKAPFIWYLIGLFLVHTIVRNYGSYKISKIGFFAVFSLFVLIWFYVTFMGTQNYSDAVSAIFSRAFTGGIAPAYFYLEYFPKYHEFLFGRSFPNPGGLLPFENFRLTAEVMNWLFPELEEKGIVGTAPTIFWGEIYANFGLVGIPIFSFVVGCIVVFVVNWAGKLRSNPIKVALFVWLALRYMQLANTGFSGFIIDINLVSTIFICFAVINMSTRLFRA